MTLGDGDSTLDSEENEDELCKSKSRTSGRRNLLLKWEEGERIYGPLPHNPTAPPPSNPGWSMVLIKDNHNEECSSLIFPPIHHENLHLKHPSVFKDYHDGKPVMPLSSSSSSSASLSDESNDGDNSSTTLLSPSSDSNQRVGPDSPVLTPTPKTRHAADVSSWVNLGLEMVYSKVRCVLGSVQCSAKVSSFTTAAMVLGFLYFRWRRRRVRVTEEDRDRLVRIIKEKDERIDQLLNQIARMNNVLLALQRVPAAPKP
ncbi:hypothetical protein ACH5RR_025857 [Cinchona calisaya]|uniref:Transmembrane protein n=1 Tax=Cinchona calisaya TaxID=153742 RepID=A0ABD2Z0U8_9GENT